MSRTELTVEQCRALARLRARWPDARLNLHATGHGLVVEVQRGRRVALARLGPTGVLAPDQPLRLPGPAGVPRISGALRRRRGATSSAGRRRPAA